MDILTPAEFQTIRETLGLTEEWLANHLGVSPRTVRHWIQGKYKVPEGVALEIRQLEGRTEREIRRMVAELEPKLGNGPVVITTYRSDTDYRAICPDSTMPAAWHRAVAYRVRLHLPGVRLAYAHDNEILSGSLMAAGRTAHAFISGVGSAVAGIRESRPSADA